MVCLRVEKSFSGTSEHDRKRFCHVVIVLATHFTNTRHPRITTEVSIYKGKTSPTILSALCILCLCIPSPPAQDQIFPCLFNKTGNKCDCFAQNRVGSDITTNINH